MPTRVPSPCVGVCILDPKWGQYCIGCHRMAMEIANWSDYSEEEKSQIILRIETLKLEDREDYPKY